MFMVQVADNAMVGYLKLLTFVACGLECAFSQRVGVPTGDLTKLGVDELFSVEVTSVGRKAQELSKAPAAVFVLTAEDIRRSGATSIPEALQWVPGLTVLRIDGRSWAISARGSARQHANKILVLIDGRSLYTPMFSGVFWDAIDVPLEDIEQIEVVRGPGAVMWGPNAVNGVINIITKHAQATTGLSTSLTSGNELQGSSGVRWGAALNDGLAYRIWGKADYTNPGSSSPGYFLVDGVFPYREPSAEQLGGSAGRMGFRFDGQPTEKDQWMVQGDLYKSSRRDPSVYGILMPGTVEWSHSRTDYQGGYLQGRWTRLESSGDESTLQFSYSKNDLTFPFIEGATNNLTFDYQKRVQTGERNEIYWGAGYQQYWDSTNSKRYVAFDPPNSVYRAGDAVLRDEWQFVPDRLTGSAGVRLDYTSYGHLEYQPGLRLMYTPDARQSAWVAASRALRLPSRFERDTRIDSGKLLAGGIPLELLSAGSKSTSSEVERSLEAGYRVQSGQRWSIDISAFFSSYRRLAAVVGPPAPVVVFNGRIPSLALLTVTANPGAGSSRGAEIWGTWQLRPGWRLMPSYSFLEETWKLPEDPATVYRWQLATCSVPHQAHLRSQHDLSRNWKLDVMARVRSRNTARDLPGAFLVDARLGWRPLPSTELSFALKNLTDRHVLESYAEGPTIALPTRRTFVVNWTYRL